jgi:hypothetical protein
MIRAVLMAALGCLPLAARTQSGGFQPLPMESAKATTFKQYTLRLAGPDKSDKPTMWEGPLTVSSGGASCSVDISLVNEVYAATGRDFVIVLSTSGSNAIVNFIELQSCASKWAPIKRSASTVKVVGNRVLFLAACEGGESNAPAQCTSARVYAIGNDSPPAYLRSESYRQTAKDVGVGFTGEARVMNPHSPRAMVVH